MSEAPIFLDVNVAMYAAGTDQPYKEACAWLLNEVADGRFNAAIDTEIIQEILYRYGALQQWQVATAMSTNLLELVPTIYPVTLADVQVAIKLFDQYAPQGVKARDVIHAAVMQNNDVREIVSTDGHFDLIDNIIRLDPRSLYSAKGNR